MTTTTAPTAKTGATCDACGSDRITIRGYIVTPDQLEELGQLEHRLDALFDAILGSNPDGYDVEPGEPVPTIVQPPA